MNKLTKEQAQGLIETMQKQRNESYWNALIGPNEFAFMERALNQCTEQEFPSFNFKTLNSGNYEIRKPLGDPKSDDIVLDVGDETAFFKPSQFKEFTQGCQKICEWLENE